MIPTQFKGIMPELGENTLLKLRRFAYFLSFFFFFPFFLTFFFFRAFRNTQILIVDEISMVGCNLWENVSKRLMQIRDNQEPFGGLSVLVVGDFNQVSPVKEGPIFRKSKQDPYAGLVQTSLWSLFRLYELTEIMRQRDDRVYAEIVKKIGEEGIDFCTAEQIALLDSRIVSTIDEIPSNAIILAYENKTVHKLNRLRINSGEGVVIKNSCVHVAIGPESESRDAKKKIKSYDKIDNLERTEQLPKQLLLKIGRKYMITKNMDASDGLCNGTIGTLMKIINDYEPSSEKPGVLRLWFDFIDKEIGRKQRERNSSLYHTDNADRVNFTNN